jgi:hypothetical protein
VLELRGILVRTELVIATALAALVAGAIATAPVAARHHGIAGAGQVPVSEAGKTGEQIRQSVERRKSTVQLESSVLHPGVPLAESDKGVYGVRLSGQLDKQGNGRGSLELEPNAPAFDEFGFGTIPRRLPSVTLECTLSLVKKHTFSRPYRRGLQAYTIDEEWLLFKIQGPKIISRLFLAITADDSGSYSGRLLVHDKDGKVQYAVGVATPLVQPCHPGCFPAGTAVHVPGGTKPIESIREGDLVTTVGPGGVGSPGQVESVFVTRNRLVEVRTDLGSLLTTETQPFSLSSGGLRPAGELKAGDRICCWNGGESQAATVHSVSATGREAPVFNLNLGSPAIFVANGCLVRSKPPPLAGHGQPAGVVPSWCPAP